MSKYWSKLAKSLEPYTPGEWPKDSRIIKLNTNENPYPPSPRAVNAIKEAAGDNLRLYPDPTVSEFKSAVAEYYSLKSDQVFAGNGSDEILAFCFPAFFNPDEQIIFPSIGYGFFPVYARYYGQRSVSIPLDKDFSIPVDGFMQPNGGMIFANPNSPTGVCMPLADIMKILVMNPDVVVVVDEAYVDFGGETAAGLVDSYPNLLVVQTLSKSRSLAGLRLGFALGDKDLICALETIKNCFNSYTIDRLALAGGIEAVRDKAYFDGIRRKVIETRDRVRKTLLGSGFAIPESKANFLFINLPQIPGAGLHGRLREKGILVRHFNVSGIDSHIRVSIGKDADMDVFLDAMRGFAASCGNHPSITV